MGNTLNIYILKDLSGKEIIKGTAKQIGEYIGESTMTIVNFFETGNRLNNKYFIEKSGEKPYRRSKDSERMSQLFSKKMLKEWRYMNEHYGLSGKKIAYPFTVKTYRAWLEINRIFSKQ